MINIECKNHSFAEHIMYFLNSLPKKDVKITVVEDGINDFYSARQKH